MGIDGDSAAEPTVVIRGETIAGYAAPAESLGGTFFDLDALTLKGLAKETYSAFRDANLAPKQVDEIRCSGIKAVVLPKSEYDNIFSAASDPEQRWSAFRRRFGATAVRVAFSSVGWSETGTHALVYMEILRGAEDAHGVYLHLTCASGVWVVEDRLVAWLV